MRHFQRLNLFVAKNPTLHERLRYSKCTYLMTVGLKTCMMSSRTLTLLLIHAMVLSLNYIDKQAACDLISTCRQSRGDMLKLAR